jgi:hypothetical protein
MRRTRKLSQFVDEYMLSITEGSNHKYLNKTQVIMYAKQGLRSMLHFASTSVKSVVLDVPQTLFIDWPLDFAYYTKIGVLREGTKELIMLTRQQKINVAVPFEKDINDDIVLDADGIQVLDDGNNEKTNLNSISTGQTLFCNFNLGSNTYHQFGRVGNRNAYGYYRPTDAGIELSSDFVGSQLVLEYIGDPTMANDPMIDLRTEDALRSWIYYKAIEGLRGVPLGEKQIARKVHYADRRVAKQRMRPVTLDEIVQQVRKNSGKNTAKS